MSRTLAVVAMSPASREQANKEPLSTEIWGTNSAHTFLHRADRWFEIHHNYRDCYPVTQPSGRDHIHFLQHCGIPVYLQETHRSIPTSRRYPREEIVAYYGREWLTSSVAYMVALAVMELERGDELKLYGVDMVAGPEYTEQLPCAMWYLGIARGKGIKVTTPEPCSLFRGPLYGVDPVADELYQLLKAQETASKELFQQVLVRNRTEAQVDQLTEDVALLGEYNGSIDDLRYRLSQAEAEHRRAIADATKLEVEMDRYQERILTIRFPECPPQLAVMLTNGRAR